MNNEMKRSFVKNLLTVYLIIILTGCASTGYHKGVQAPTGAVPLQANLVATPHFIRPVTGTPLSLYGDSNSGIPQKGILLSASENESVVSAEAGVVQYVNSKMPGYGRTVIIEHSPSFTTVYAGLSEILVKTGQTVAGGEAIGKAGQAGKGEIPQIYFEIRRNAKTEDPRKYLNV